MATMRNDDHETTTQHNNATPIRRVDARTHDKTHNRTTPLLLAKRGVHASSSDYMVHQLSPEYFDTSHYYCTSIQVPHISYRMRTNTSVYVWVPFGYIDHTRFAICAVSTCFGHFFVVSCHCHVRQEPAAAGHRDEHSGRRSSSNNGGQCGQCVLPTVRRSLIVHLFRRLHSESLKHTSNGDTHRYTAAYDM